MKQAKLIELGQMLEAWRHQVLSHGRTLTVQELKCTENSCQFED